MSINEVRYLPECGSTNAYVKEHFEEFGPVGAVYTTNQTAGRGRLGRSWVNAEGKALYYTVAIREPLAQPATLPVKITLGLGQIDADAAQDAPALLLVAVGDGFAQDADDLLTLQQKVVGPFDLAVHTVAQLELAAHGKAGQQGQGGGLR